MSEINEINEVDEMHEMNLNAEMDEMADKMHEKYAMTEKKV